MKISLFPLLLILFIAAACDKGSALKKGEHDGFTYEYVENDPLNARIYTLPNGLKVYLSKYDAAPRIQTQIAVKAGGKNDPATNTGLAHYLEHIMFKGTADFGTVDWAKEEVLLDSIERMFNHYATLKDSMQRVEYYKLIDKVSNEAAKYAIANEYDKMVVELGAQGTNAYTSEDRTVYINDIPSNQIEKWLRIEANRFQKIVPRLFHTELEAVYEEKNRSLDNDYWKSFETMYASIFTKHPYGTQTVIGTIDHLKNPSITEILKYFDTYYRPNNVAICLSGDLDYEKTIKLIDQYFGGWKPNENLPAWTKVEENAITAPVVKEVYGPDSEWLTLGYRFDGRSSRDYLMLQLTNQIMSNDMAGLIDLNLKQQQKVLEPESYVDYLNDYCIHALTAKPREGQTLEEVQKLLLEQIELLKKGEFEDWLVDAVKNDLKKEKISSYESNWSRSNDLVLAFTNNMSWDVFAGELEAMKSITKEDIVKFANEHYGNNYVAVLKKTGKDPNTKKVTKPQITKVPLNKEEQSEFHKEIASMQTEKLKPVFVNYESDIQKLTMNKDLEVLYTPNKENGLFSLYYVAENGTNNNPALKLAVEYLEYVGTESLTAEELKKEFYKLGCSFGVSAGQEQTYVYLTGLSENMDKAMVLFEDLLTNPKADEAALRKMVDGEFKKREDNKKEKGYILFSGLLNYALYGPNSPFTNVLTNKELQELKPETLLEITKNLNKTKHRVLYYGPSKPEDVVASLNKNHRLPETMLPEPVPVRYQMTQGTNKEVYWTHYEMVQEEAILAMRGGKFDASRTPMSRLYNEYMATQTFQELREAQGLAYSVWTYYSDGDRPDENDLFYGYIGTQADKQVETLRAMNDIITNMPESEVAFQAAKDAVLNQIESERILKQDLLFDYLDAQRLGLKEDLRKTIYENAQKMTLSDVKKFQQENIKNSKFSTVVIADRNRINVKDLNQYGKVKELSLDEIFGYEKVQRIKLENTQVGN